MELRTAGLAALWTQPEGANLTPSRKIFGVADEGHSGGHVREFHFFGGDRVGRRDDNNYDWWAAGLAAVHASSRVSLMFARMPVVILLLMPAHSALGQFASDEAIPADPPVELKAEETRNEADADRLASLSHFATARILEHRDEPSAALRHYQRAYRLNSGATAALVRSVELAFVTNRSDVALRYATKLAETDAAQPEQVERLAEYFEQTQEFDRAAAMTARLLELRESTLDERQRRKLQTTLARLWLGAGDEQRAAEAIQPLLEEIESKSDDVARESEMVAVWGSPAAAMLAAWGRVFLAADEPQQAEAVFRRASAKDQDLPLEFHLAQISSLQGNWEEVLRHLEMHADDPQRPIDGEFLELYVSALAKTNRQDELPRRLAALREGHRGQAALDLAYARACLAAGNRDEAFAVLDRLAGTQPDQRILLEAIRRNQEPDTQIALLTVWEVLVPILPRRNNIQVEFTIENTAAVRVLAEALLSEPAVPDETLLTRRVIGISCLAAGEIELADRLLSAEASRLPQRQRTELYLAWGLSLLARNHYDASTAVFRRAFAEGLPEDEVPVFRFYEAASLAMADKKGEALTAIEEALRRQPDAIRLQARRAWIHYHANDRDQAKELYERLVHDHDSQHDSPEGRMELRDARLALSHLESLDRNYGPAEEWLEQVLDEFPDDIGATNDLAFLWVDQGKHLRRSLAMIERAVAAEPKNAAYLDSLGWAHYRLGNYTDAVARLRQAAESEDPDPVILDHLGDALLGAGEVESAVATWRKALEKFDPNEHALEAETTRKKLESHAVVANSDEDSAKPD